MKILKQAYIEGKMADKAMGIYTFPDPIQSLIYAGLPPASASKHSPVFRYSALRYH
jgi:hypothetical protein